MRIEIKKIGEQYIFEIYNNNKSVFVSDFYSNSDLAWADALKKKNELQHE